MKESAIVKKIDKNMAIVTVDKKLECSKCGMCAFPKNANKIDMRAKNPLNAKVGDEVVIEKTGDGKLTGALLAFLVPLVLIGISSLIALLIIKNEIWIPILSVILIILWYVFLALIDKKLAFLDRFLAVIIEIKSQPENKDLEQTSAEKQIQKEE